MSDPTTIRDLVDVVDRPRVVRLDDLTAADPGWITATYHATPEVAAHLETLRRALAQATGVGMFLIGQYGSGKSHLLAYVAQNLAAGRLIDAPPQVVSVSLLNYPSEISLEQVTTGALKLSAPAGGDRRIAFHELMARYPQGVFLILDELSEFLRSKRERSAFTEDVRYLQFLGEWCAANRLFVIASMQEQIEHTGDLEHGLYRKIKDRYPLRFLLTRAHVRELVRDGILRRRDGYLAAAQRIAGEIAVALPGADYTAAEIAELYPIHPATLALLDEVRDSFSQARGAVDFVVTQLLGDPRRGLAAFLDRPVGDLLTPDRIIDHFRDLLESQPDHLPLAQQLFPYYERHLAELFEPEPLRELAGRVLKLLVLDHLAPAGRGITAQQAASWLLYRPSRIDADRNVAVLQRVLDRLADAGRHVARRDDRFELDFADSDAEVFERRLRREIVECEAMGGAVVEELAALLVDRPFNPYALPWQEVQHRSVRWHFHERHIAVFFGALDPPRAAIPVLVVRPLFADAAHGAGVFTLLPRHVIAEARHFELLALVRLLRERWSAPTTRRIQARIEEKRQAFEQETRGAFVEGRLLDPTGADIPVAAGESKTFEQLLDRVAQTLLRRLYPGFERFAPCHGPLTQEAFRRFARFCLAEDLCAATADEYVTLIREAYLVPMGVLVRRGHALTLPADLEKRELVRLLLPLIEQRPVPKSIYQHLAQPIYGLVPDQVHLLLVVLLAVGELDLIKGGRSYRELFELLPDPLNYERVEPAVGLSVEAIGDLRTLCEGLGVTCPPRWHVLGQRRAIERLRQAGQKIAGELEPVLFRLGEADPANPLVEHLHGIVLPWRTLEADPEPLTAFETFRHEIGNAARFVERVGEARKLPGRIERVAGEMKRCMHVLEALPAVARAERWLDDPGAPPDLLDIDAAERWVGRAAEAYREYRRRYQARHDDYWRQIEQHPILQYRVPAVARSRHAGLDASADAITAVVERVRGALCRGVIDLSFQATCRCGFDGVGSPHQEPLALAIGARDEIEAGLRLFFGQEKVRDAVRKLVGEGLEDHPAVREYLERRAPYPELRDVARFDRQLSGVAVTRVLHLRDLASRLRGRSWDAQRLLAEITTFVHEHAADGVPIRFADDPPERADPPPALVDDVMRYCLRYCVAQGVPLPDGIDPQVAARSGEAIRPEELTGEVLSRIDRLKLPLPLIQRWLGWVIDGVVRPPPAREAEADWLAAAREVVMPSTPGDARTLARLTATLYRSHQVLRPIGGERWLERLERVAHAALGELPPLTASLMPLRDEQWLLIDAFGLPLFGALGDRLGDLLGNRRIGAVGFAEVAAPTTTDACYRDLIAAGLTRELVKIDAIDELLHTRDDPFDILVQLAATELQAAWRRVAARFDQRRPIVVFADHGFRLDRAGRRHVHGGASTLERVVPILRLDP